MNVIIENIIRQLMNVQNGKVWVGATYNKSLEAIDDENAFIRPIPDMHSVAEIISHLTVWQKDTILKLKTGVGSLRDDSVENWIPNDTLKEKKWASLLGEYKGSIRDLIELLRCKDDSFLDEEYYDTDFRGLYPYSFVINGMLHHSLYHLGQLGIIIKYLNKVPGLDKKYDS